MNTPYSRDPINQGNASHPAVAGSIHLAALLLAVITSWMAGLGGALVGLVAWFMVADKQSLVARHAAQVFNFNFSFFIYSLLAFAAVVLTLGLGLVVVIPLALLMALLWLVFSILGAIAGFNGRPYRYPLTINFIR